MTEPGKVAMSTFEFGINTVPDWWNSLTDSQRFDVWNREVMRHNMATETPLRESFRTWLGSRRATYPRVLESRRDFEQVLDLFVELNGIVWGPKK